MHHHRSRGPDPFVGGLRGGAQALRGDGPRLRGHDADPARRQPQYQQAVVAMRLTDEMPDIVENIDTLVNSMAENKVTTDLTPWFEKQTDFTQDSFLLAFLDAYRPIDLPDELHGMPVSADAYVLYYNADLFEKYGVDLPTDDWTWDEFLAAAKTITTQGAGQDFGFVLPRPAAAAVQPGDPVLRRVRLRQGHGEDGHRRARGPRGVAVPARPVPGRHVRAVRDRDQPRRSWHRQRPRGDGLLDEASVDRAARPAHGQLGRRSDARAERRAHHRWWLVRRLDDRGAASARTRLGTS